MTTRDRPTPQPLVAASAGDAPDLPTTPREARPSPEWVALVERGAVLCSRDPAAWSAAVRRGDELVRAGMERAEATGRALDEVGA